MIFQWGPVVGKALGNDGPDINLTALFLKGVGLDGPPQPMGTTMNTLMDKSLGTGPG